MVTSLSNAATGFFDPLTGKQIKGFLPPAKGFEGISTNWWDWLAAALTADGRKAALADAKGSLRIWDLMTAKLLCVVNDPPVGDDQAVFSPDGKTLAVKHKDRVVRLWDTVTGKPRCTFDTDNDRPQYSEPSSQAYAFSSDGRTLATGPPFGGTGTIRLWDTVTGKQTGQIAWEGTEPVDCLVFTPDDKRLVSAHGANTDTNEKGFQPRTLRLCLWDVATGRELQKFDPRGGIQALAISADGKTLAAPAFDNADFQVVRLWEMATGLDRGRFEGHRDGIRSLAFSPDGRLLASGSEDFTALVWDVTGVSPGGKLIVRDAMPAELEGLWDDLASADGVKAFRAIWAMAAAVGQSVPFVAERIQPIAHVDNDKLAGLVADLDSDNFKTRTQATKELEKIAEQAEGLLRQALAGNPTLEVRQRVLGLLDSLEGRSASPKHWRIMRGLEVLEHAGTPEASRVLEELAKGAPGARLTEEAKAALERYQKTRQQ